MCITHLSMATDPELHAVKMFLGTEAYYMHMQSHKWLLVRGARKPPVADYSSIVGVFLYTLLYLVHKTQAKRGAHKAEVSVCDYAL